MSRDVDIDFLGVFDTVASVGAIFPRFLPFSQYNGKTRVFRHALALDECRAKFRQETWQYTLPEKTFSLVGGLWDLATFPTRVVRRHVLSQVWRNLAGCCEDEDEDEEVFRMAMKQFALEDDLKTAKPVDIKEVWFAGDHCDIGGSHNSDFEGYSLSDIPLRWMIKEALKSDTRILFDETKLNRFLMTIPQNCSHPELGGPDSGKHPDACYFVGTYGDDSAVERLRRDDVRAPLHNSLSTSPFWWLLEFLPILERSHESDGKWNLRPHLNLFSARTIPQACPVISALRKSAGPPVILAGEENTEGLEAFTRPLVHKSVLERMQLQDTQVYRRTNTSWYLRKEPYRPFALQDWMRPIYVE